MTTIKDIARLSGYSIGTVSRVINHHPDVKENTRRYIEKIIQENNFQPNSNAKLLKQTNSKTIVVLVKGTNNVFFESLLEEIQKHMKNSGEDVNVVFLDETADEVAAALQVCAEGKPKGMIFMGGNLNSFRSHFGQIKVPCVLLTESADELGFDNLSSYTTDDRTGGKEAVDYLIHKGHRRIGILGGSLDTDQGSISYNRIMGAVNRMKEKNLDFDMKKDFEPCRYSMRDGCEAMKKLLQRNPDLTAVFALSDLIAIGALRAAYDMGLRVPEDISVIGYDGIDYARYSVPRIATIQQNVGELAKRSVEDLLLRISYSRSCVHEVIPFRVIAGESVSEPADRKESKYVNSES